MSQPKQTVWIAENVYDPTTWEKHEVDNINALLASRWTALPANTRIYWKYVAQNCDVTPAGSSENVDAMAERLERLDGVFFVMCYPEGLLLVLVIIAVVLAAAAIALTFIFRPKPKPDSSASPNNSLSNRENTARPNERIPDIVGTVRSVPDVIGPPYRIFEGNQEAEYGYFCVGNGSYTVSVAPDIIGGIAGGTLYDIKDDLTNVQDEASNQIEIYGPNTSPNSGDAPVIRIGAAIDQPIINIIRSSSVTGQILRAPNDSSVTGSNSMRATGTGTLECNDSNIDFTAYFGAGDTISLLYTGATDPGSVIAAQNLSGNYELLAVTSNVLTFASPNTVNPNWANIALMTGGASNYQSPQVSETGPRYIGWFIVDVTNLTEIWCNIVAPNGLYKTSASSGNQYRIDSSVSIEVQPLDSAYAPVGPSRVFVGTVEGSAILTSQRAITIKCVLPQRTDGSPAGRVRVRGLRTTGYDTTWQGTNADQLQWRDLFAVSPVDLPHFGDVTTIQTKSFSTASALVTQSRKLNLEVTRNIPVRTPASPVKPDLTHLIPSRNAADIVCFLARDPYLGSRPDSEINFADIYAQLGRDETRTIGGLTFTGAAGAVQTYFGTSLCTEFCYTFDDTQTTFEEMMGDIGQAVFSTPYRRGSLLSFFFERQQSTGVLLFNHRNKIPSSETRTVTFGLPNDYDGIELDYIDPNAPNYPQQETTVTLYFPPGPAGVLYPGSATSAKKVTLVGVRNNVQAQLIGWRMYNKLRFQNTTVEFKATAEAAIIINTQRMLVADNTRPDVQDGEIIQQDGLTLITSQPVTFVPGKDYVIYLQESDGTIEAIPITEGPNNGQDSRYGQVALAQAPVLPLALDPSLYARTTYQIAGPPTAIIPVHEADIAFDPTTGHGIISDEALVNALHVGDQLTLIGISVTPDDITSNVLDGSFGVLTADRAGGIYTLDVNWTFLSSYSGSVASTRTGIYKTASPGSDQVTAFLLTQKTADDGSTYNMQAINYDDGYYANDTDFIAEKLLVNDNNLSNAGFPALGGGGGGGGNSEGGASASGGDSVITDPWPDSGGEGRSS